MRHAGKNIRRRAGRGRGSHAGKSNPRVDYEVFVTWLGLSLLHERIADGDPPSGPPDSIGRGARRMS